MTGLDRQRAAVLLSANASLKRIAWAYGCSHKGSEEERQLEQLLRSRVEAERAP